MALKAAKGVEWARISTRRRIMFALIAVISLTIFLTIAWLDLQAGNTGAIDMAIMGGTLAGGAFAAFTAITGKEQRKVTDR